MAKNKCIKSVLLFFFFVWDGILILVMTTLFLFFGNNSYNHIYKGYSVEHLITMVLSCVGSGGTEMPWS